MTRRTGRVFVPALTLLLAALICVTSLSAAAARARMPAGWAEICSGMSVVMVPLGPDGEPMGPPHFCPDGAMALFAAEPPGPVALPVPQARAERLPAGVPVLWSARPAPRPQARGPPSLS